MCTLTEAACITIHRILQLDAFKMPEDVTEFVLNIKYGFDGSGGHTMYNQIGNCSTNNMILAMFCPLSVATKDINDILWTQNAPNSEFVQRPILIEMGKGSEENLQSLAHFNEDIRKLKIQGLEINGKIFFVNIAATCLDRKAANIYLGIGGAYCDLCTYSKQQCCNESLVEEGFKIDRDISTMQQIFLDLVQDNGDLKRKPNDYPERAGQTAQPIADYNVRSVQVLHALLRSFDHLMKVVIHLKAGVMYWTESKTDPSHQFLEMEKRRLQAKILEKTGIKWNFADSTGHSGNTTTGNVARSLLYSEENRILITEDITNTELRSVLLQYATDLSHILRVLSSGQKVNLEAYSKLCSDLYLLLIRKLPWVRITPTIHKLLAHSAELIELNSSFGLKGWSEEGLESNIKRLRTIRLNLSRKNNQINNLTDIFKRLWLGSDPLVCGERVKGGVVCNTCKEVGHRSCKNKAADDLGYLFQ